MTARSIFLTLSVLAAVLGGAPPAAPQQHGEAGPGARIEQGFRSFPDSDAPQPPARLRAEPDDGPRVDAAASAPTRDGGAPAPAAAASVPLPRANPMSAAERDAVDERRRAAVARVEEGGAPLDVMIGQMLMVGFQGDDISDPGPQRILAHIRAGRLGGVLLFRNNVKSAAAVKQMTRAFRAAAPDLPVLVAVDQEGGRVERLTRAVGFGETPAPAEVATRGEDEARTLYSRMARGLADFGFNVNLAPVVDLAARRDNPIITRLGRAFSADPATVTALASEFVDAHRTAGVITALKHFPGHGSSSGDTHHGFVDVSGSWTRSELEPFRAMIAAGRADMVMVAHVHHADFSPAGSRAPATLSPMVIDGLLRGDLGYDGVVISDDMEMGAITKLGSPLDVAARAILAGNDILVYAGGAAPGQDLVAVLQRRIERAAVRDPRVAERIRESYARIVRLKRRLR